MSRNDLCGFKDTKARGNESESGGKQKVGDRVRDFGRGHIK